MMDSTPRDERLWKMAKRRADFKKHLTSYVLVNLFLWGLWWFTAGQYHIPTGPVPWPAWVSLGWGLGLGFNYFEAYGDGDKQTAIEKEYEKLKRESEGNNQQA
jgi:hypothetical protein